LVNQRQRTLFARPIREVADTFVRGVTLKQGSAMRHKLVWSLGQATRSLNLWTVELDVASLVLRVFMGIVS